MREQSGLRFMGSCPQPLSIEARPELLSAAQGPGDGQDVPPTTLRPAVETSPRVTACVSTKNGQAAQLSNPEPLEPGHPEGRAGSTTAVYLLAWALGRPQACLWASGRDNGILPFQNAGPQEDGGPKWAV
jgi:hypothetical protein